MRNKNYTKKKMKGNILNILNNIHLRIFGYKMSDQMRLFVVNLSWSMFSGTIFLGSTVIIMTIAGRLMGPFEYGKLNLLIIINQFLVLFVFFGLDITTIRIISKAKNENQVQKSISSSFYYILFVLVFLILLSLIFKVRIESLTGFSYSFILALLIYTVTSSIKAIFDVCIRGLGEFKTQAKAKLIEVVTIFATFVILFIIVKFQNYISYSLVVSAGAIVIAFFYLKKIMPYLSNFSFKTLKHQLNNGKFFMLSALIGTLFLASDRLLIAKFIDLRTLGVYSAYYAASLSLAASFSQLFVNVFFPITAKHEDKQFSAKIDKLTVVGFIPLYIIASILITVAMVVFGKDYEVRFDFILLFAMVSVLYFFQSLYNTIILSLSQKLYKKYLCLSAIINLITVFYYFSAVKMGERSIGLIVVGLIINLFLVILVQRELIKSSFPQLQFEKKPLT